jgi:hypothetical protein
MGLASRWQATLDNDSCMNNYGSKRWIRTMRLDNSHSYVLKTQVMHVSLVWRFRDMTKCPHYIDHVEPNL